jgi:hypothetical protein
MEWLRSYSTIMGITAAQDWRTEIFSRRTCGAAMGKSSTTGSAMGHSFF